MNALFFVLAQSPVLDPSAPDFDALSLLPLIAKGAQSGQWGWVSVLLLVGAMWMLRSQVLPRLPQHTLFVKALSSRWGGWGLSAAGSLLAAVGAALATGQGFSWSVVVSALITTLAGAGVHELGRDVKPLPPAPADPAKTLNA